MTITKDMSIPEIVEKHPETKQVFGEFDIRVDGYKSIEHESIFATARVHQVDLEALLAALNKAAN